MFVVFGNEGDSYEGCDYVSVGVYVGEFCVVELFGFQNDVYGYVGGDEEDSDVWLVLGCVDCGEIEV